MFYYITFVLIFNQWSFAAAWLTKGVQRTRTHTAMPIMVMRHEGAPKTGALAI